MGIQLDWEVESDIGHEEVTEDPAEAALRQKRVTRTRRLLVGSLILISVIGLIAFIRLRQVDSQRRAALDAVVDAEALALRLGDEAKFMALQGPSDQWRAAQIRRFRALQTIKPRIVPNGDILETTIRGDEAQVTVRVMVGTTPDKAVWLYSYTDKGWKHIATTSEPSMEARRTTKWFTIIYPAGQEALARSVEETLDQWWQAALKNLDYSVRPHRLQIILDPEVSNIRLDFTESGFVARMVGLMRDTNGGELSSVDGNLRKPLAHAAAIFWASEAAGQRISEPEANGVRWFEHQFNPEQPSSNLFDALAEAFGPTVIPEFYGYVRENHLDSITAMRNAVRGNVPIFGGSDVPVSYLTNFLRTEAYFRQEELGPDRRGIGNDTVRVFFDQQRGNLARGILQPVFTRPEIDPSFIVVSDTRLFKDILWARTSISYRSPVEVGNQRLTREIIYVPFRLVNGKWLHTWAQPSDWGVRLADESQSVYEGQSVTLLYYSLDEPIVNPVMGDDLRPILDGAYRQIAFDFGLDDPPRISIPIVPDPFNIDGALKAEPAIQPIIPSRYTMCCVTDEDRPQETMRFEITRRLIEEVYNYQRGETRINPTYTAMDQAFLQQERSWMNVSTSEDGFYLESPFLEPGLAPTSPEVFWNRPLLWDSERQIMQSRFDILAARWLIAILEADYEAATVEQMIKYLPTSDELQTGQAISYRQWLDLSIGAEPEDINDEWRQAFNETLISMGYQPIP